MKQKSDDNHFSNEVLDNETLISTHDHNAVISPIIFPEENPYYKRSEAFIRAAKDHPLKDYLILCGQIAKAQAQTVTYCLSDVRVDDLDLTLPLLKDHPNKCLHVLKTLLNQLLKNKELNVAAKDIVNVLVRHVLNKQDQDFLSQEAECLMALDLEKITIEFSPFIGAALQVFYTMQAHQIGLSLKFPQNIMIDKVCCPCCGMPPIASVIDCNYHGLRYLHCSVCETKWYLDSKACHECSGTEHIERVTLQNPSFSIKAESCDDCMTYLKWLDLSKDHLLDVFVEDLISRDLDAALLAKNYLSTSQNFYMLTKTE